MSYVNLSIQSIARCLILVVVLFFVSIAHAQPTTYYVNGSCGNDSWTGLNSTCAAPNGPKLTIQAAINTASDEDEIEVADGTYTGNGNRGLIIAKRIHIHSASNDPSLCIIDCQSQDRGATFAFGTDVDDTILEGFTIRNGFWEFCPECQPNPPFPLCCYPGGGISMTGPAKLENCWIIDCESGQHGGGLSCVGTQVKIFGCKFEGNQAAFSGGAIHTLVKRQRHFPH